MIIIVNSLNAAFNIILLTAAIALATVHSLTGTLPDYNALTHWKPSLTSRLYARDGSALAEFARQRRLFLPLERIPARVRAAFLAAEDKNFYQHPGIDLQSVARALLSNVGKALSGDRLVGASTITQQVAKNFLLNSDRTFERKLKEALVALRIDQSFSKDQLLELYLNDIYLGVGAYGVAQAALSYFGKGVDELTIAEAAYLAALPKGPNNYHPLDAREKAVGRRNWVIAQMQENGFIRREEAAKAVEEPLLVKLNDDRPTTPLNDYFTEEVRRFLLAQYGGEGLYTAGFTIRTTLDPHLQATAMRALRKALVDYDEAKGYRGPVARLTDGETWQHARKRTKPLADVPEWQLALVTEVSANALTVQIDGTVRAVLMDKANRWALCRLSDGRRRCANDSFPVFSTGDVVYVEETKDGYRLRQPPEVQGALVSMEPSTGRVIAMAGGFSYAQSQFNRATQAYRQPGSSFKPFVYAAALDTGYTPTTLVLDGPLAIPDGAGRIWRPKNYDGRSGGPSTLRVGLENSRNQMTVRLARTVGMDVVVDYGKRFGLYDQLQPYLPMSLGAGETTLMRLVSAYSVIANGGRDVRPSMIDRIQDRSGRTIFRQDSRYCPDCNVSAWSKQPEPEITDDRDYVLDPMTAYQITSMLQGVVERGTARSVKVLGVPVAGKTGTTNDEKDVWFVGYTPELVTGIFIGYDIPRHLGSGETGGGLAAPVFIDFMKVALAGRKRIEFIPPKGMAFHRIERRSGVPSEGTGSLLEAFKPGTGPCAASCGVIGDEDRALDVSDRPEGIDEPLRARLLESTGGLY